MAAGVPGAEPAPCGGWGSAWVAAAGATGAKPAPCWACSRFSARNGKSMAQSRHRAQHAAGFATKSGREPAPCPACSRFSATKTGLVAENRRRAGSGSPAGHGSGRIWRRTGCVRGARLGEGEGGWGTPGSSTMCPGQSHQPTTGTHLNRSVTLNSGRIHLVKGGVRQCASYVQNPSQTHRK